MFFEYWKYSRGSPHRLGTFEPGLPNGEGFGVSGLQPSLDKQPKRLRHEIKKPRFHFVWLWSSILMLFPLFAQAATDCTAVTEIPQAECETLVALYNATDGPNWTDSALNNWNVTNTPCSWRWITCSGGRVTRISRGSQGLKENLPDLSALTQLQELYLPSNQLSGSLPDLSALTQLQEIELSFNKLSGSLPNLSALTQLQKLDLSFNKLSGSLPDLSALTQLQYISLSSNQLSGNIPDLSALTQLQKLYLSNNQLSGSLPDLSALTQLESLWLYNNQLSGTIPDLSRLTALVDTNLGYNQLTGETAGSATANDSDWADTQTVPPTNVTATAISKNTVQINWNPISYTADNGHYLVKGALQSGGPYTNAPTTTTDKLANSYEVTSLSPGTTYYFVVETVTKAHGNQQNDLTSALSMEVSATTSSNMAPTATDSWVTTDEDTSVTGTLSANDVEGGSLTYRLLSNGSQGTATLTDASTGAFSYTPNANANGTDSFTFNVNDGSVDSNTATVTVTINAVNDAPVLDNTLDKDGNTAELSLAAIAEDAGAPSGEIGTLVSDLVALTGNVTDVDSGAVTGISLTAVETSNGSWHYTTDKGTTWTAVSVLADNNALLLVADAETRLYFQPNENFNGTITDAITFRAWDQSTGTAGTQADTNTNGGTTAFSSEIDTAQLNVTAVNDAPTAASQLVTTDEDTPAAGTLSASDIEGDSVTYRLVSNGSQGTATLTDASTGAFRYTPNANTNGTDSFTFNVNDGTVDSNTATVTVTINAVNDAPTAASQLVTTDEDTPASGTLSANDVEGGSLTYRLLSNGSQGTATLTDASTGAFSYTPNANANGTDSFTFNVNDGSVDSNTATVTVTINAVNDAPTTASQLVTTDEDTPASGTLSANDVEGGSLTYRLLSNGSQGTATLTDASTGAFSYTPNANANGTDSFTFNVNDGSVDSNTATVTVTINAVNDAPVLDNTLDKDGNTAALSLTAIAEDASAPSGELGTLVSDLVALTGNVTDVDSGAITGISLTAVETSNGSWHYTTDNGTTWTAVSALADKNALLLAADAKTRLYFQPNENFNSIVTDAITFRAWDQSTGTAGTQADTNTNGGTTAFSSEIDTAQLNVTAVNDAPTAASQLVTTDEDTPAAGTLSASDTDGDSLTYRLVSNGSQGTATLTDASIGAFSYTPNANANGTDSFTFNVNDGSVDSNTATVTVTINAVNDAPTTASQLVTTDEDTPAAGTLSASDTDGDSLTYRLVSNGSQGTATLTDASIGAFSYTPNANANGTDSFTFNVNDGSVDSNTATVTVTINAVNDAPTTASQLVTTDEDTPASGTLSANDVEGGSLTYRLLSNGSQGTATLTDASTGAFSYTPNANANGTDSFTFNVNDGSVDSNTATVTVTINAVNDAPVLDNTLDKDGNTAALSLTAIAEDASAPSGELGTLVSDLVALTGNVTDVDSGAMTGISLTAVETSNGSWHYTTDKGTTWTAVSALADNNALLLVADAETRLYFQPNENFNGTITDAITFRAWDQSTGTAGTQADASTNGGTTAFSSETDTANLTVTAVNDAPTAASQLVTTDEDILATGILSASDVEGESLTYRLVSNGSQGTATLTDASTGAFSYTPNANANGTDSFTFNANDGSVDSNTATVTVTINAVNDAPTAASQLVTTDEDTPASGTLSANDVEGGSLTYRLLSNGSQGTATLTDANTGAFSYTPNANANGTDSFTFLVSDGTVESNIATVNVTINAVNDAPSFTSTAPTTATQPASYNYNITVTDVEDAADSLTITAPTLPSWLTLTTHSDGTATLSGTPEAGDTGSQKVSLAVQDTGLAVGKQDFTIEVSNTNTAPVLDNSGSFNLTAISANIGEAANTGTLVSALLASAGSTAISDADSGTTLGIAVIAVNNDNGTWQYDQEGGTQFIDFPADLAADKAVLLAGSAKIRLVPKADYAGTLDPGMSFRVWDRSSGNNGKTEVDTTNNGGNTAFSTAVATASLTVTPINQSPTFTSTAQTRATAGIAYSYLITATDVEDSGNDLSFNRVLGPNWLTLTDNQNGTATLAGTPTEIGANTVSVQVVDSNSATATHEFVINVIESTPPRQTLTLEITGQGMVSSTPAGINCGSECVAEFAENTSLTLSATPADGFRFREWRGDCSGNKNQLTINLLVSMNCQAHFETQSLSPDGSTPGKQSACSTTGMINKACNAQDKPLTELTIEKQGDVSNGIVKGHVINHGWLSNSTVQPEGVVEGGTLTGYLINRGTMIDIDFRGGRLSGDGIGTLSGTVINNSPVDGPITDMLLAAETYLSGGRLAGEITGDADAPALLEEVEITAHSMIKNVMLGRGVTITGEGVTLENVWLAPNTRLSGVQIQGYLSGDAQAPARLDNVTVKPGSYLDNVIIGREVLWPSEEAEVSLGTDVQFITAALGLDLLGNLFASQSDYLGTIRTEAGQHSNGAKLSKKLASAIHIETQVFVEAEQQRKPAKLLMVAYYTTQTRSTAYMRAGDSWKEWNGEFAQLEAAETLDSLPEKLTTLIFEGDLSELPGEFTVYVGYQLEDESIIFNGNEPIQFVIEDDDGD
jgi:hypothetical protein